MPRLFVPACVYRFDHNLTPVSFQSSSLWKAFIRVIVAVRDRDELDEASVVQLIASILSLVFTRLAWNLSGYTQVTYLTTHERPHPHPSPSPEHKLHFARFSLMR